MTASYLFYSAVNDFIPHCLIYVKRYEDHFSAYTHVLYKINEHLLVNNKINQPFLIYFLDKLLRERTLNFKRFQRGEPLNIKHMTFSTEEEKMRELKNNLPDGRTARREKYINIESGDGGGGFTTVSAKLMKRRMLNHLFWSI